MDYAPDPVNKHEEPNNISDVTSEQKWLNNFFAQDQDFKIEELKLPPGISSDFLEPVSTLEKQEDQRRRNFLNRNNRTKSPRIYWYKGRTTRRNASLF